MKLTKLVGLIALLTSTAALSHGHGPISYGGKENSLEAVSLSPVKMIDVTVVNTSKTPTAFDITVDNVHYKTTKLLTPKLQYTFSVPVTLTVKNKVTRHNICSTNVTTAADSSSFRLMMCTDAQLYYYSKED